MRRSGLFLVLCLTAREGLSDENWFLPYAPDEHTVALFHLDGDGEEERNAAEEDISLSFKKEVAHGPGKFGRGAVLNGRSSVLHMGKSKALCFRNDQEFTVELWCNPDTNGSAGLVSIATRYYLHIAPGFRTATFGYRAASFPIRYFSMANIPIRRNRWNHVALTHDKDRVVRLYVNGRLAGFVSHKDEGDYPSGGTGTFGAHDGWTNFFAGAIDEIRISSCIREFRPLVTQTNYLPGEQVRLAIDTLALPDTVQSVEVKVVDGRKTIFEEDIPRAELAEAIVDATTLPEKEAQIEVTFLGADGTEIGRAQETVLFAGKRSDACKKRLELLEAVIEPTKHIAPLSLRREGLRKYVERIDELVGERDFDAVEKHLKAAERIAHMLETGQTLYRARLRNHVRAMKSDKDIRVSMSWFGEPADAFPWAKRIGANELVGSASQTDPSAYDLWKEKGYLTAALSGVPIHDGTWLAKHPQQRQYGFWRMDPVKAEKATLNIKLIAPSWGGHTHIDHFHDPKLHWKVVDVDDRGARLEWTYDTKSHTVTITNAVAGHTYLVYFMFTNLGVGDPLYPPFQKRGLEQLESLLEPAADRLQVYWFDDLGFAYPGPTPQKAWDWESYTLAARPETQKLFTKETGIEFDPEWLVMPPKTIEMVPDERYLTWMEWVQDRVARWMVKATDLVRKHGMQSWLYWGDCHVGIEPFLGSLDAGKVEQIDKPASDPVTARALIDFPGDDVYRRLRVNWLYDHICPTPKCGDNLDTCWRRAKRGLLMNFPSALYWATFDSVASVPDPAVQEDDVETIAEINDEFQLLGYHLTGHRAFTHDINLYVINSWGKVYSWRPWGAPRLAPLTDLPINVRFISLAEIAKDGVPKDAHVLFNYGQPNSSWSGGRFWKSPELKVAIEAFVRNGGGFIGLQSPSHCDQPQPHWALSDLLGVTAEGTAAFKPDLFDQSMLADTAREAPEERRRTARLSKTKAGQAHWVTEGLPAHVLNMAAPTRVSKTATNAETIYAASDARGSMSPGTVCRDVGKGRTIYLASWSSDYAFHRLMRRAIFWAAHAEKCFTALDLTEADDLFCYAYPSAEIIAVLNAGTERVTATLRCHPEIFNHSPNTNISLRDVATSETVFSGAASELLNGTKLNITPNCVILLKIATE